jgi:hypothetical protein
VGIKEQTTVLIASDHGFARPTRLVNPNVILRKAGLLRPTPRRRAVAVSQGGTAFVYLTQPKTTEADRAQVIALLQAIEGIAEILQPDQYSRLHLPAPATNPQMGDLILVAKDGYAFADEFLEDDVITPLANSLGSHGYLSTNPRMNGVWIAWGRRIKPGTRMGVVDIVDVAPTMAALLDHNFSQGQGKVIQQMLLEAK